MATEDDTLEALPLSDHSDTDSTYSEESMSTASLRSSIYDYQVENGRTYHAFRAGKYALPNDDGEKDRMDIHYHAMRLVMRDRLFFAPVRNPLSILDVGAGTGIWAMDAADEFPAASVMGIDLSPIQPTDVPPNLQFLIMDADEPWDMPARFDFVHTRFMNGFSIRSWRHFYEQAFEALKPGCWVENQEFDLHFFSDDGTLPEKCAGNEWADLWEEGVQKMGLTGRCDAQKMRQHMIDVGFVNVNVIPMKLPVGPWPKDKGLRQAGLFTMVGLADGLTGLSVRVFTQLLGWNELELEVLLAGVRKEWKTKGIHSWMPLYIVQGQKPPV